MVGCIRLSPHSRLRRQYGVIHNVTARAVNIAGNQMLTIINCRGGMAIRPKARGGRDASLADCAERGNITSAGGA